MKEKTHLFFDIDGTLLDSQEGLIKSLKFMLLKMGVQIPSDEALRAYLGPPVSAVVKDYIGEDAELSDRAYQFFLQYCLAFGLFDAQLYDGMKDLLFDLKKAGKHLYIATGKRQYQAVASTKHFGIFELFDGIYGVNKEKNIIEKEEILSFMLKEEGISASDALMIGDRIYDVQAGLKTGVDVVAVSYGYAVTPDEFKGAALTVSSVEELRRTLL